MKRKLFGLILCLLLPLVTIGQTVVQMIEDMGVYKVPCEVNGLKVKMIFDTGASAVSLSQSFAEIMIDNGCLSSADFSGESKSLIADGSMVKHTNIILRRIKIGDITLNDVKAIVVNNQSAPLLFGQSAIQLLGDISIKGDKLYINRGKEVISASSKNSFEKWDADNYIYTNHTYGFGWNLPADFEWKRIEGHEKHTAFRAEGGPIAVFVNVQVQNQDVDLWTAYDKFTSMLEQMDISLEKRTGQLNYERTFEKCSLFGKHAIKTTFKEYFKDSRYEEPIENYAEEYIFIKDGYNYVVAVKLPKEVYEEYDYQETISDIFKGFRLSVKQ